MKKFLFLALLSSVTMFAQSDKISKSIDKNVDKIEKGTKTFYGDVKDGTVTIYQDAKDVVKYLTPEAKNLIVKIAQKLEKTTDQVWDILVRQQKVWSWCYLLLSFSAIFLWVRFYIQFNVAKTDLSEENEVKEMNVIFAIVLFIFATSASIFSSMHFIDMMTGFMNPEYGAMKNLYQVYQSVSK
jgi:hypothetical protein